MLHVRGQFCAASGCAVHLTVVSLRATQSHNRLPLPAVPGMLNLAGLSAQKEEIEEEERAGLFFVVAGSKSR